MGWCQAFGPQIRAGCDHSMVAGTSSCSCPECGAVCEGRFSGCATVWADGPQPVQLRRPSSTHNSRLLPQLGASNGRRGAGTPSDVSIALPVPRHQPSPDAGDDEDLRSLIRGLHQAIEALPARIGSAAGEAMRHQHAANRRDLETLWRRIAEDIEAIDLRRRRSADAFGEPTVTVDALDERFEWLVDELSKRLVAFGNELVRIEQRLSPPANGSTRSNGSPSSRAYPSPRPYPNPTRRA